jgi:hypothetical protein
VISRLARLALTTTTTTTTTTRRNSKRGFLPELRVERDRKEARWPDNNALQKDTKSCKNNHKAGRTRMAGIERIGRLGNLTMDKQRLEERKKQEYLEDKERMIKEK